MRLTYILAVVIASTLHTSGTALSSTKESNHAAISNVASTGIVHSLDAAQENSGRMLHKVKENEEERAFMHHLKYLRTSIGKCLPWTHSHKIYKSLKNGNWNTNKLDRKASAIRYATNK
ncbi:hypothetical protein PR001_g19854 [Phytophthora rubi]|uniref:RxLR effector protein n=1 Tax=Phytophthora rubi TaxID=129364 RepID=A0A6A3JRK1_9STRA|nr:hypothetical protein PR002_g23532 [Phytophthora rubi]KAE8996452.1 hypothetical protein PR001_g19854 [Phytophthora rubi]